MSTAQARNRRVIARFLESLPQNQGWWYRVPKLNYKPSKSSDLDLDDIMPHLGTLFFGLTEDATAMILVEMGGKQRRESLQRKRRKYGRNEAEARNDFVEELKTIFSRSTMLVCHLIMEVIWKDCRLGD
jgi:hypothetical protein